MLIKIFQASMVQKHAFLVRYLDKLVIEKHIPIESLLVVPQTSQFFQQHARRFIFRANTALQVVSYAL